MFRNIRPTFALPSPIFILLKGWYLQYKQTRLYVTCALFSHCCYWMTVSSTSLMPRPLWMRARVWLAVFCSWGRQGQNSWGRSDTYETVNGWQTLTSCPPDHLFCLCLMFSVFVVDCIVDIFHFSFYPRLFPNLWKWFAMRFHRFEKIMTKATCFSHSVMIYNVPIFHLCPVCFYPVVCVHVICFAFV